MTRQRSSSSVLRYGSARPGSVFVLGLVLSAFAFAFTIAWNESHLFRGLFMDDAYISLRHAKNFAEGNGLVYNPGERVEGYTNFSLTALLVIPYALHFDPVSFLKALGWISGAVALVSTGVLTRRLAGDLAAVVIMLVLALDQRFGWFCSSGMETMMVSALYVPALLLLDRRKVVASAVLFVLAALTRMEVVLLVAVAAMFLAHRGGFRVRSPLATKRRLGLALRFVITFGALYAPYYAWRTAYYGWPFPNTYYAKVGSFSSAWHRGLEYFATSFVDMGAELVVAATACAVVVVLVARLVRRGRPGRGLPLLVVGCLLAYALFVVSVGGDHFRERFVYHLYPLLLAAIAWAWTALAQTVGLTKRVGQRRAQLVVAAALAAFLVRIPAHPVLLGGTSGVAAWQATGAYLRAHAKPGSLIATDAAGVIALESDLPTVDILGLTDAHIAHLPVEIGGGVAGHEKSDPGYVIERAPAFVTSWLDADGHVGRGLRRYFRFWKDFEIVGVMNRDIRYDASPDRLVAFEEEPSPAALSLWREGHGAIPGRHDWAVWGRRKHALTPRPFGRLDLGSNIPGAFEHADDLAYAPEGHAPAHLMFGPGMIFMPGTYRVAFQLHVESTRTLADETALCHSDVWDGVAVAHPRVLTAGDWLNRDRELVIDLDVEPGAAARPHEFRLHCDGLASVSVRRGDITLLERSPAEDPRSANLP